MARIHRRTIQKISSHPDNHDDVVTHLEPDILECEVKRALGSITANKASGSDRTPGELFQTLKDDASVLHSICQQIWKTQQWPQDEKRSVFIPIPKKGNAKECSNYHTTVLISHASKVMLKILQGLGFNSMWTENFQMYKLDLEKAEEPEIKLPTSLGSSKKHESSRKTSTSALLTMPKSLTVWITTNCGKFWKKWEYQTTWPASWEICMQVKKQELELNMNSKLVPNQERSTSRQYIVTLFI